jgi:hypothetical protein
MTQQPKKQKIIYIAFHGDGTIESILGGGHMGTFASEEEARDRVKFLLSFYGGERECHIIKANVCEAKTYKTHRAGKTYNDLMLIEVGSMNWAQKPRDRKARHEPKH